MCVEEKKRNLIDFLVWKWIEEEDEEERARERVGFVGGKDDDKRQCQNAALCLPY